MESVCRIKKINAVMRWVESNQQWAMYNTDNDMFIMNLFDCQNISRVFPDMKKDVDNEYEMILTKV
ncbi:MAG: hypothetical protein KAJ14_04060 [Candidatus Omnitrophica bacterium]|nr:hypothetical protein [Candidatus Omnitrophota bacterium]MCK5288214.1 hypothetical protein [Candidatus Omnitrophota bacterium]MCK5492268.1 hypothetical protein [Candidatus Omnitrophota bacterium]